MHETIPREIILKIRPYMFSGKIIVLSGPSQIGKTTCVSGFLENSGENIVQISGKKEIDRLLLASVLIRDILFFELRVKHFKVILLDDIEKIPEFLKILRVISKKYRGTKQIIVCTSTKTSTNALLESLSNEFPFKHFTMYGVSVSEISSNLEPFEIDRELENLLVYGSLPEVYLSSGIDKMLNVKKALNTSVYEKIIEPGTIAYKESTKRLLCLVAAWSGKKITYRKLGRMAGLDGKTVKKYLAVLEDFYIIFRYSEENKWYFYDLGIRNAILDNFSSPLKQVDSDVLWKNFVLIEYLKICEYYPMKSDEWFDSLLREVLQKECLVGGNIKAPSEFYELVSN